MGVVRELTDFGAFYERAYPRAYAVAFGLIGDAGLAEDATQDAFVAAYRQRARYRGDGPVEAWLYRIVVNAAISTLRRRRGRAVVALDSFREGPPLSTDATEPAVDAACLAEALRRLDHRARAAVVLRYYLDLDYATIARVLDTSPSNVGVILTRSRDRLRSSITADADHARIRHSAAPGGAWHG